MGTYEHLIHIEQTLPINICGESPVWFAFYIIRSHDPKQAPRIYFGSLTLRLSGTSRHGRLPNIRAATGRDGATTSSHDWPPLAGMTNASRAHASIIWQCVCLQHYGAW